MDEPTLLELDAINEAKAKEKSLHRLWVEHVCKQAMIDARSNTRPSPRKHIKNTSFFGRLWHSVKRKRKGVGKPMVLEHWRNCRCVLAKTSKGK